MTDRCSRPHRSPADLVPSSSSKSMQLRRQRLPAIISRSAPGSAPPPSVAFCSRLHLNRWRHLHPAPPVLRYEHPASRRSAASRYQGMTRFSRLPSWRWPPPWPSAGSLVGRTCTSPSTITPASLSPACCPTRNAATAIAFLRAAVPSTLSTASPFAACSPITAHCYRSATFAPPVPNSTFSTFTRPYTPRTNGKAERFIQTALREWAYARHYLNSEERDLQLSPGSATTTSAVRMVVSATLRPSAALR